MCVRVCVCVGVTQYSIVCFDMHMYMYRCYTLGLGLGIVEGVVCWELLVSVSGCCSVGVTSTSELLSLMLCTVRSS